MKGLTNKQWIVISAIIAFFGIPTFGLQFLSYWNEINKKTELGIDNIRFNGTTLSFRVSNFGDATAKTTNFQYIRLNQTSNTCGLNATFFNSTWTHMCYFRVVELSDESMCQVNVPVMSSGKYYDVEYPVSSEWIYFHKVFSNATSCRLDETIQIYATDGRVKTYSQPANVETYISWIG